MLQIKAPHFTAGLVLSSYPNYNLCTRAAPIIKYMVGWTEAKIVKYCERKNWRCIRVGTRPI